MSRVIADNILIIGAGLIGGSLAKGLRQRGLVGEVVGYARNHNKLHQGMDAGVIDAIASDLPQAIHAADVIVLGVPTLTVADYLAQIEQHRKPGSVVTDVASVKGEIVAMFEKTLGSMPDWFVPGHPIAGSEKSGILASDGDLYVRHKVILTPLDNTDSKALESIAALWRGVGAEVVSMSVESHDRILAATSHLPHALAFVLVDTLSQMPEQQRIFEFAAGGFRDFTRIASSHPVMWHDIMLANKTAIISVMDAFREHLDGLEQAIRDDDTAEILAVFERAKAARDDFARQLQNRQEESL